MKNTNTSFAFVVHDLRVNYSFTSTLRLTMFEKTANINKSKNYTKWKPLSATEFDSLIYPCVLMCSFLGFFPYKCHPPRYVFSKSRFVLSAFVIFIYIILLFLLIYELNFTDTMEDTLTRRMEENFHVFLDGIVVLVLYFQTGARLRVLQSLSEVSSILSSKDFNGMAKIVYTKDICGFLYLVAHIPNCFKKQALLTVRNFVTLYIVLVHFSVDMLYMNCVYTLKECFKKMNECLRYTGKSGFHGGTWTQEGLDRGQRNNLLLMTLKQFENRYLEISDAIQLLNDTFTIKMIVLSASTFGIVTLNSYFAILFSYASWSENLKFWYGQFVAPAVYHFVKFSAIIWTCQSATDEAQKIKCILYDAFSGNTDAITRHEVTTVITPSII